MKYSINLYKDDNGRFKIAICNNQNDQCLSLNDNFHKLSEAYNMVVEISRVLDNSDVEYEVFIDHDIVKEYKLEDVCEDDILTIANQWEAF